MEAWSQRTIAGTQRAIARRRIRLADRVAARLRGRELDRALAAGARPEASAASALRAQRLARPSERRKLARSLRRVVREARLDRSPSRLRVPLRRGTVVEASHELGLLAHRLVAPGPVGVSGVAQARLLLSNGLGPLYNPGSGDDPRDAAQRAIEALRR
jgi:hypothetical protein